MNAREQSPERDPYKHGSTIFDRHKGNSVERIMFSTNDTETTEYPHAKKKKLDFISHHMQKLIQNGSNTYI